MKREQLDRQALGEELITLSDAELSTLPLDERLGDAVRAARTMKSHGALRRQKQLIGKLMRDVDPEPIRTQLQALRADDLRLKRIFANAERWRDTIIRDGAEGLTAFESEIGKSDMTLRNLLAELEVAISDRAETTVRRNIFRRVHEILGRIPQ
mgnify:FL=1